jgi:hypothetical protein
MRHAVVRGSGSRLSIIVGGVFESEACIKIVHSPFTGRRLNVEAVYGNAIGCLQNNREAVGLTLTLTGRDLNAKTDNEINDDLVV